MSKEFPLSFGQALVAMESGSKVQCESSSDGSSYSLDRILLMRMTSQSMSVSKLTVTDCCRWKWRIAEESSPDKALEILVSENKSLAAQNDLEKKACASLRAEVTQLRDELRTANRSRVLRQTL